MSRVRHQRRAIFIATDQRMFAHATVLLRSIQANYPDHPEILLRGTPRRARPFRP